MTTREQKPTSKGKSQIVDIHLIMLGSMVQWLAPWTVNPKT